MHPVSISGAGVRIPETPVIAVIPSRYRSTRFPGKPLVKIFGRPLIEHVYRRTAEAPSVGAVIVATDDKRISSVVEGFGGTALLTSPSHQTGTDRIAEVAKQLNCDLVVNVQGDEPFIEPDMIEQALLPLSIEPSLKMSTLRCQIDNPKDFIDPNVVKVVTDEKDNALYFSRAPIPFTRNENYASSLPIASKHIGLYVYRRDFLLLFSELRPRSLEQIESLEQLRALEYGFRIKAVKTDYNPIGIDTPEDLEKARQIAGLANNL